MIKSTLVFRSMIYSHVWSGDLLAGEGEDKFYVAVRGVLKDMHQLVALVDLTRVLLDVLDANGCLAADGA